MAARGAGALVLCLIGMLSVSIACSQPYPAKPIRLLVGFPAGSSLDSAARIVAAKLSDLLQQNVVVDNRAGAAGNIATEIVARARPDGYTLLMGANGALAINPALYRNLPFDSVRDFAPVSKVVDVVNILVVNAGFLANSVEELITLAKAKPLLGGSSGIGSPGHLALELFNMMAGTTITHVSYKGSSPALIDVMAGNIQIIFATAATAIPLMKAAKIRGIAVATIKRSTLLPDLPTVSESGLRGFEVSGWYGVLAPAQTPRTIVNRLNAEIGKALQMPDVRQNMFIQGLDVSPSAPEEFAIFIRSEIAKWGKVVRYSGAKPN
jgi:tripartite-type tricarboxylate transporter receptor subunit TctC